MSVGFGLNINNSPILERMLAKFQYNAIAMADPRNTIAAIDAALKNFFERNPIARHNSKIIKGQAIQVER